MTTSTLCLTVARQVAGLNGLQGHRWLDVVCHRHKIQATGLQHSGEGRMEKGWMTDRPSVRSDGILHKSEHRTIASWKYKLPVRFTQSGEGTKLPRAVPADSSSLVARHATGSTPLRVGIRHWDRRSAGKRRVIHSVARCNPTDACFGLSPIGALHLGLLSRSRFLRSGPSYSAR